MIEISNLLVQFGGVKPINDLSANITAPISGLIGPNGAGKTTLLNVLSGFVTPVKGKVLLNHVDLLSLNPLKRVRLGLRRSFQTEQVVEDLSVRDNLAALADNVLPANKRAENIDQALNFINLDSIAHQIGGTLNLFQRRMIELGKCLIGAPTLILLDEPAAGLTDDEGARLREHILRIPKEFNAQVLVIDHDVELIKAMCSEILVLDYGKKLALGPTAQVLADPEVQRAYLGEF